MTGPYLGGPMHNKKWGESGKNPVKYSFTDLAEKLIYITHTVKAIDRWGQSQESGWPSTNNKLQLY